MALISCPNCGNPVSDRAAACPKCGMNFQTSAPQPLPVQNYAPQQNNAMPQSPTLTSEQEAFLDKFNWGAFVFSWIWALCNNLIIHGIVALIAIFCTSGLATIIVCILLGAKGNHWAWEKNKKPISSFIKDQRSWNKWGKIVFALAFIPLIFFLVFYVGIFTLLLQH